MSIFIRPYRRDSDDSAVVTLYARIHVALATFDATTIERWRAFAASPLMDSGRAFRVATDDERVLGLLTSAGHDDPRIEGGVRQVRVLVDPEHWRRGIGRALVREAEAQARASGNAVIQGTVDGAWDAARAFATSCGFDVFVRNLLLRREAKPCDTPPLPAGMSVREASEHDAIACAEIHNATLVRDAEFARESEASMRASLQSPGATVWLACAPDPVGFCFVQARGERGFVHEIGVLGAWEGRGIGAALLARGLESLRARGVSHVVLATEEDNARAQRLYDRFGFRFDRDTFTVRRTVRDT